MRVTLPSWIGITWTAGLLVAAVAGSRSDENGPSPAAGGAAQTQAASTAPSVRPADQLEWAYLYIMSYDNNLSHCTEPITRDLRAGLRTGKSAVAILSDRPGPDGLRFVELRHDAQEETLLETDDITDPDVLTDFLRRATQRLPARRYVVVFLNHGGRLDEMCFDEFTTKDRPRRPQAMSATATARVLKAWRAELPDATLPLLFLQQCGRGSIENLYSFAGVADFILASQTVVGACNTYYTETLKSVEAAGDAPPDGAAVAARIMATDRHYTNYALVRDAALRELPRRLDAFVAACGLAGSHALAGVAPCFDYQLETNYDLLQVVRFAAEQGGPDARAAAEALSDWVRNELIAAHRSQRATRFSRNWCGLSTHVPLDAAALRRYQHLPLYRESRWADLIVRLSPDAERPR